MRPSAAALVMPIRTPHPANRPAASSVFQLGSHGIDPAPESFLKLLHVDLAEPRPEMQRGTVGVGAEPPQRGERDVGDAPAKVRLDLDLERSRVDGRLRERLEGERRTRDPDEDGTDDRRPLRDQRGERAMPGTVTAARGSSRSASVRFRTGR